MTKGWLSTPPATKLLDRLIAEDKADDLKGVMPFAPSDGVSVGAGGRASGEPHAETPRESRQCLQCECTAWHESDGPDGLRSFQCAAGHLLIIQRSARS